MKSIESRRGDAKPESPVAKSVSGAGSSAQVARAWRSVRAGSSENVSVDSPTGSPVSACARSTSKTTVVRPFLILRARDVRCPSAGSSPVWMLRPRVAIQPGSASRTASAWPPLCAFLNPITRSNAAARAPRPARANFQEGARLPRLRADQGVPEHRAF